jgi:hypothetical protein
MPRMKLHSALLTLLVVIIGASAQIEGDTVVDNIIQALSPSPESTADAETVLHAEVPAVPYRLLTSQSTLEIL